MKFPFICWRDRRKNVDILLLLHGQVVGCAASTWRRSVFGILPIWFWKTAFETAVDVASCHSIRSTTWTGNTQCICSNVSVTSCVSRSTVVTVALSTSGNQWSIEWTCENAACRLESLSSSCSFGPVWQTSVIFFQHYHIFICIIIATLLNLKLWNQTFPFSDESIRD